SERRPFVAGGPLRPLRKSLRTEADINGNDWKLIRPISLNGSYSGPRNDGIRNAGSRNSGAFTKRSSSGRTDPNEGDQPNHPVDYRSDSHYKWSQSAASG